MTDTLTQYLFLLLGLPMGFAIVDGHIPAFLVTESLIESSIDQKAAGFEWGRRWGGNYSVRGRWGYRLVQDSIFFHAQVQCAIFIHFYLSSLIENRNRKHLSSLQLEPSHVGLLRDNLKWKLLWKYICF